MNTFTPVVCLFVWYEHGDVCAVIYMILVSRFPPPCLPEGKVLLFRDLDLRRMDPGHIMILATELCSFRVWKGEHILHIEVQLAIEDIFNPELDS